MKRYISLEQIRISLDAIASVHPFFGMSFLAFKKIQLPVGSPIELNFTRVTTDILEKYYRPTDSYSGFYNPFSTSNIDNRWQKPRYPSTTLQRITKDTFGNCLMHPTKKLWGWHESYIKNLMSHINSKIPAFDLAVWLYRDDVFERDPEPESLIYRFYSDFHITEEERQNLFDESVPIDRGWLSNQPITKEDILDIIGHPPDSKPAEGAALASLTLTEIGPAENFTYKPSERLNIITGDNSLGKTFLLDSIWWALTGEWSGEPIYPRSNVSKSTPTISYAINANRKSPVDQTSQYSWDAQKWKTSDKRIARPGLTIYSRSDGSIAIWDPARDTALLSHDPSLKNTQIILTPDDIWHGLQAKDKRDWICNGVIRDWINWQTSGSRHQDKWESFRSALQHLSPLGEALDVGEPTKLFFSDSEYPTIKLPYGEIPINHASAGIKRAISLAYSLVWAWHRHLDSSSLIRQEPQRRIILIIDEAEAHLHPRWQRTIIPSILNVIKEMSSNVSPQIHLATHSPMILASLETVFDENIDDLHHLRLDGSKVILEELRFIKRGRFDLWLMSDAFGLKNARSIEGEKAIEAAKDIQMRRKVSSDEVIDMNRLLIKVLAQDDDFWPRWRFFAEKFEPKQ